MIQLQLILAAIRKFWKPALAVLLIAGAVWFVMSWRERGIRAEAAEAKAKNATELARKWHDVAQECSAGVLKLEAANRNLEAELATELAQPPETITVYRDRVQTVTETVLSDDCPTAIGQIAALLADTPNCEEVP